MPCRLVVLGPSGSRRQDGFRSIRALGGGGVGMPVEDRRGGGEMLGP